VGFGCRKAVIRSRHISLRFLTLETNITTHIIMKLHHLMAVIAVNASPHAGTPAPAATLEPIPAASDWEFRLGLPGWISGIEGDVGVFGAVSAIDVPFDDIVSNLDMVAAANFEARKGRWGLLTGLAYMELSGAAGTPGPLINNVTLEMSQLMIDAAVSYALVDGASCRVELLGGARYNPIDLGLNITSPLPVLNRDISGDKGWVDPYVGFLTRAKLAEPLTLVLKGDIGGFGVSSDITWQAYAGLEYQISKHMYAGLGYRALGVDYTDGGFTYDVITSGIQIELGLKF